MSIATAGPKAETDPPPRPALQADAASLFHNSWAFLICARNCGLVLVRLQYLPPPLQSCALSSLVLVGRCSAEKKVSRSRVPSSGRRAGSRPLEIIPRSPFFFCSLSLFFFSGRIRSGVRIVGRDMNLVCTVEYIALATSVTRGRGMMVSSKTTSAVSFVGTCSLGP